jgi:formylglycine-generating enzyme required for sulfatase activity
MSSRLFNVILVVFSLLAVALGSAGCGATRNAGAQVQQPAEGNVPPVLDSLPGLAELAELPASPRHWTARSVSAIEGTGAVATGGTRNYVEGSALSVVPGSDEDLAWAVYTQGGITEDKPVNVQFDVAPTSVVPGSDEDLPLEFWIGLSNYTTYRWEWLGPFSGAGASSVRDASVVHKGASAIFTLPLNSETLRERYVSKPDGTNEERFSYVVAVTSTADPDRPHAVQITSSNTALSATYFSTKPHFVPVFDPTINGAGFGGGGKQGSGVVKRASSTCSFGWEDIDAPRPAETGDYAANYIILRQTERQQRPQEMDLLDDAAANWEDSDPPPGTRCVYYLVARNDAGDSAPSGLTPVEFDIDPPDELRTEYIGNVGTRIYWPAVQGAVDYDVYARAIDDSFATFLHSSGGTPEFLHQPAGSDLGRAFYYTVVAKGESFDSQPSVEVRGCAPNRDEAAGGGVVNMTLAGFQILFDYVPGGNCQLGSPPGEFGRDDAAEGPYQTVFTSGYYICETEVSNKMYAAFVDAGGYTMDGTVWTDGGHTWRTSNNISGPPNWGDPAFNADPVTQPNYPVQGISWYEARAFSHWLSSVYSALPSPPLLATIDLPSELEWEYAAEGPTQFDEFALYPWSEYRGFNGGIFNDGNDGQDMALCNSAANIGFDNYSSVSSPVTAFGLGRSWCGALNMAGNVLEWTREPYRGAYPDPWQQGQVTGATTQIAVRGGNYQNFGEFQRTSHREIRDIDSRYDGTSSWGSDGAGIRLVLLPNT